MQRIFYDTQKEEYIWVEDKSPEYKELKKRMRKVPYRYYEWFNIQNG